MNRFRYTALSLLLSMSITAGMSYAFHGAVRVDFLVTGAVCAVVVEVLLSRVVAGHRRALAEANALLDRRIRDRTAELERANLALRKEIEGHRELERKLLEAEGVAVAGGIAAGVCHEIKNPLAALFGNIELADELVERGEDPAEIRELLRESLEAARHAALITADLQTLARGGLPMSVAANVAQYAESAVRLARPYLRQQCDVVVDIPPDLSVQASPSQLVQVLVNLLVNAARASRPHERNTVTVRAAAAADGMVALEVQDTGIGMTEAAQQRLFDPVYTTRRSDGGTGLGLHLCRTIVSSYGGSISFHSTPERGSTFRFTLPMPRPAGSATP